MSLKRTLTDALYSDQKRNRTDADVAAIDFDAKTLDAFGYKFDEQLKLVRNDGSPFVFVNQVRSPRLQNNRLT